MPPSCRLSANWWKRPPLCSSNPDRAAASAADLGIAAERSYDSFAAMAKAEAARPDGIDAVAIVTPNHLHASVAMAFLRAGIPVICDKPLTTTVEDAEALVRLVAETGLPFILTQTYTGYPMVREARAMLGTAGVEAFGIDARRALGEHAAGRILRPHGGRHEALVRTAGLCLAAAGLCQRRAGGAA